MTEALNMTTNAMSGFAINDFTDGSSWFSIIIIVGIASVLLLLFTIALSGISRYKKIKGTIRWFVNTLRYFFFGLGGLGVLAIPTLILFYFGNQASQGNVVPIWITLSIIGGYFVIAGLGYIFKKYIVDRIKLFEKVIEKEDKKEKEEKEEKEENEIKKVTRRRTKK